MSQTSVKKWQPSKKKSQTTEKKWQTSEKSEKSYKWFTVKPQKSDIRMTYEYIWVTYGWHTSTYGWHTITHKYIRVTQLTFEYIPLTNGTWVYIDNIQAHANDMRMTQEILTRIKDMKFLDRNFQNYLW